MFLRSLVTGESAMSAERLMIRESGLGGRGSLLVIVSIVFNLVAVLMVVMRMISRTLCLKERGWDDYTILFSVVSTCKISS